MKQLELSGPGRVSWATTEEPRLASADAAIVQPVAAATCDFDHLMVKGAIPIAEPFALGHECVARVLAVGEHVSGVSVGDLVVVSFQIACGACATCRRGRTSSCERVPWLSCFGLGAAAGAWGGVVSDRLLVPYADAMLVPLPAGVSAVEAASVSCNVTDAYRCVAPPGMVTSGARVLVASGAFRNIALYSVIIAKALGAEVDFFDRDPRARARAAELGAHVIEDISGVEEARYPVTVDASMDPELLAAAITATAPAGTCTASTMYLSGTVPLPLFKMFQRGVTFRTGQPDIRTSMVPVLDLLASRKLDLSILIDDVLDWEQAPLAFLRGSGKVVCARRLLAV